MMFSCVEDSPRRCVWNVDGKVVDPAIIRELRHFASAKASAETDVAAIKTVAESDAASIKTDADDVQAAVEKAV
jgi:hypothetical protein